MIDLKKKCWREKVTAEITLSHIQQFAGELGTTMSPAEVAEFFNQNGTAQVVWIHMMEAAEQCIKSSLEAKRIAIPTVDRPGARVSMVQ
jgi:Ni,Fe-hydrogenase I small subunit